MLTAFSSDVMKVPVLLLVLACPVSASAFAQKDGKVSGGADALYAFDKGTGEELWSGKLGARSNANPMTYRGKSGRQYVVIAAGTGDGNKLVAFALPDAKK